MRDVKVLKVYNLVNAKGNKLRLRLGILKSMEAVYAPNADHGYRWSFVGEHIPMPVRSMTWFNGFPENIMLDWLKGNGWYPHTCVHMDDGRCHVYELPKGNEELDSDYIKSQQQTDKDAFCRVIRGLVSNGKRADAARIYRYKHGGTLYNAVHEVDIIATE